MTTMAKLELVNQLKAEQVYLTEIKAQIESDNVKEHAAANKQMLIRLRLMINMIKSGGTFMDVFQMIEIASSLRGMARAFASMADDGMDLIDVDICDRINDEWQIITRACEAAICGDESAL